MFIWLAFRRKSDVCKEKKSKLIPIGIQNTFSGAIPEFKNQVIHRAMRDLDPVILHANAAGSQKIDRIPDTRCRAYRGNRLLQDGLISEKLNA